jgi:hypothetical protein
MRKYLIKPFFFIALIFILVAAAATISQRKKIADINEENSNKDSFSFIPTPYNTGGKDDFEEKIILEESSSMKKSKSNDWWLNSGGIMLGTQEGFSTNVGALPEDNRWRKLYAKTNPRDTDAGFYPQNIFRLVTRSKWQDFAQSVYFKIDNNNLSESQYKNESNGVLLFNRYQDGDNLYYTGIRVDGQAVIKKKIKDKYYTLAEKEIFGKSKDCERDNNPNLIPQNRWIGIRSELKDAGGNTVSIKLYIDKEEKGDWQLVLEAKDKGDKYGKSPFLEKGYAGIRTDFMDVRFRDFMLQKL